MLEQRVIEEQRIIPYERRNPRSEPRFDAPLAFEGQNLEPRTSISAYWHILSKHRWTIVTVAAALTILVGIASFKMKPVYKSTAAVEVDSETPQIQSLNDFQQLPTMDQDFLRTQIQILKTDNLAWRTVELLRLDENTSFALPSKSDKNTSNYSERRKMRLIREFKKDLSVELIPASRVIHVSFENTDSALAAKVANSLVENYLDYNFREKYDATRQASGRMEQQLDELKAKVEKSQQDLVDYQRKHAIVDVNDKQSVVEQRLGELSTQLTNAQSDRIQKQSLYTQVRTSPEKVAALAQNELLQKLGERYADVKKEYVEALSQYGPSFPKVVRLQKQVDEYQSQIDQERNRVVARIGTDYTAAVTRESLLSQAVGRQKGELGQFNQLLVQQNILKGDFDSNQKLYQRLLEHLKDATVAAGLKSSNVHLVDPALPSTDPVRPKKLFNITLALLVGLLLGVGVAFVRESLDHSVKSAEEVEVLVSMPALAVIPAKHLLPREQAQLASGNGKAWAKNGHLGLEMNNGNLELEVLNHTTSALSEAYRGLRTSTLLSTAVHPPQVILVTSANAGEGKTTTAVNLALTLAQQQSEVLLIDCDLRKPGIARALNLPGENGLTMALAGRGNVRTSLQQFTPLPNLWTLTSGPVPPNPSELLSSSKMVEILRELRERFAHIILDSPPVLLVTDATILSRQVDGVILVVESGIAPRNAVVRACRRLQGAGAKMLGVVLNKVDLRFDGYYGSYSYKGHYGYGEAEQAKS
jgi:polysaccharide biosynthesis transport protein